MFRRLFPFRRLLATSFLLVFVNVFAGQCYCAGMRTAAAAGQTPTKLAAKLAPMPLAHACCKAAARKGQLASRPAAKRGHQQHSDQGNCCKDKSASLLSSLTIPVEKQPFVLAPALLPEATSFHFRPAAGPWNQTCAVTLVLREHLPPKIPDIRIFIQSLTV